MNHCDQEFGIGQKFIRVIEPDLFAIKVSTQSDGFHIHNLPLTIRGSNGYL